jgi:DNA-nicking Smr family endonuclease
MRLADVEKETSYVPGTTTGYYGGYGRYYGYGAGMYSSPGYYTTDKNYFVETMVYSVNPNKLLWSGTTKTVNPSKMEKTKSSRLPQVPPAVAQRPPPLAELDRRAVRQITSGKTAIDARLDLHGARQRDARARLTAFLVDAQAKGHRNVLVITGKGGEAGSADPLGGALGEPQRGVLRRGVPLWLEQPELRAVVLTYTTAGTRHGGDGALYVQLRKARKA